MTKTTRSWTLPLLVALALAAAGISLMLTSYHLTQEPGAVFGLACDAEEGGCADVLASPWAVGPGGVPTATYGAVYFGALGLWYLAVGRPRGKKGRYWHAIPLGLNLAGALLSAFLISVMLGSLDAVCWWCTLTHLINFAMLFLAWKLFREAQGGEEEGWPPARLGFAGVLLMIAWSALCVQALLVSAARRTAREASDYARTFYEDTDLQRYLQQRQASAAVPIRSDDPVRGNPAAPHTAVVFSDFQCPACLGFAEAFERDILPAMGDRLRIVYKHFPLEPECNPLLQQTVHAQACEAADLAEAARSLGGSDAFWNLHDRLFAIQAGLGQAPWTKLATEAGLDPARVAELMNSRAFRDRIREDAELGGRLGIHSTPTVFLDGKKMDNWQRLDVWQALTR
ncbi:MAG TPA: vitamin K epoxide reductase family protein [Thermoanaerobaculia bacterium]|nr:vitamin K epoxide reductase family protein [Thermoanaerobaculia bacterium]